MSKIVLKNSVGWMQHPALEAKKINAANKKFMAQSTKQLFLNKESFTVYIGKSSILLDLCNLLYFVASKFTVHRMHINNFLYSMEIYIVCIIFHFVELVG